MKFLYVRLFIPLLNENFKKSSTVLLGENRYSGNYWFGASL